MNHLRPSGRLLRVSARNPFIVIRCLGRKTTKFRRGQTIKIGRNSANDYVLAHGSVSRFHAALVWDRDEDRPHVLDNKSANGVEVDGVCVEGKTYLSGDNHIDIGEFTLILQLKTPVESLPSRSANAIGEEETVTRLFSEKRGKACQGTFSAPRQLKRVLMDLEEEERTGTLRVQTGLRVFRIVFSQGSIMNCASEGESGLRTLKLAVGLPSGAYSFSRDLEPCDEALNISAIALSRADNDETRHI